MLAVGDDVGPTIPGFPRVCIEPLDVPAVDRTPGVRGFVTLAGAPARLDDAAAGLFRRREGPDGVVRVDAQSSGSEVVITDGPRRGFVAMVGHRRTARRRVLTLLDTLRLQTRVESLGQWIRQA
jgi:transcription antitermination factor NusG